MAVRTTKSSLAKIGVELLSWSPFQLRCKTCGRTWKPIFNPRRRLPRGWWKCPNNPDHTRQEQEMSLYYLVKKAAKAVLVTMLALA